MGRGALKIFGGVMLALAAGGWLLQVPGLGTAAGRAEAGCRVGGKPTLLHEPSLYEGRLIGGPVVVGCGRSGEPLEIVAYATTKYLCYSVDRPTTPREGGIQDIGCKQNRSRWLEYCSPDPCFVSFPAGPINGNKLTRTIVGGAVPAPAARVEVAAQADGHRRRYPVVEAHVEAPRLLARLHQTKPFFLFAALLPRCYPGAVRVTSFGEDDVELGRGRGQAGFSNPCSLTFRD